MNLETRSWTCSSIHKLSFVNHILKKQLSMCVSCLVLQEANAQAPRATCEHTGHQPMLSCEQSWLVFKQGLFPTQPLMFVMSCTGKFVLWNIMRMELNSCYMNLINPIAQTHTCKARQIKETSHTYASPALWTTHTYYCITYFNWNTCWWHGLGARNNDINNGKLTMTKLDTFWQLCECTHAFNLSSVSLPCWQMTFCWHAYLADKWPIEHQTSAPPTTQLHWLLEWLWWAPADLEVRLLPCPPTPMVWVALLSLLLPHNYVFVFVCFVCS
jgi:hypothetical protein